MTLEALELGAVDYLAKPTTNVAALLDTGGKELIEKIKTAARAKVRALKPRVQAPDPSQAPPFDAGNVVLWLGPFLLVLAGLGGLAYLSRRRETPAPLSPDEERRLRSVLDEEQQ